MDEEKVTQTAMEPAQQPKPKARGGQRTQGKTASGTGRGRMAKPHASNSNTAHRKTGTQKQKSEPQNTKSPQEPKTRAEQAEQTEAAAPEQVAAKPKAPRSGQAGGKRRRKKATPKPEAKPQQYVEPRPEPPEAPEKPQTPEPAAVAEPAEAAAAPEMPEKPQTPEPAAVAEPAEAAAAPEMPEKAVQEPKAAQLPQATETPEPEDDEPELTPEQRAAAERRKAEITRTVQVSIEQIEDAEAEQAEKEADTPESTDSKVGRAVRLLIGWLLLVVLLAGMIAAGGIYWLYKKATPDMIPAVTVTVAGQQLDPVAYHWQVPVAGNHLKRTYAETLSSTPTALESDFGGGTMTLRVTPADCSAEVTVKDENKQEVFSGSAQEFAAYRFTTPGSYTAKLVVSSGEGYQSEPTVSGHQTYEFTFDVTIKATVRLNTQAVTPGGVVAVKVTGQQTDTKPSLTAELPDTGFRASATGDGWVAYLAVPPETEPGSYTIKVTVDGEVQELTLNVSKSAASFRDYTSKSRLVTPYVGADDTPQEVLDLLDTASDTIYWADTGFASPFSDKVEVTLPYGLTEYVNRTQTERKNNTGTGRTSINVVLSGRCDLIAPAGGKVLLAEKLPNVGNTLVIEHGAGVKTIYYGLRRLTVEKGAIVAQGDALGTTDKATVVEVRVGKTPVEPLRILRGQCDALRSY